MTILTGWLQRFSIFRSEPPKSPWGSGSGGSGSGGSGDDNGSGPRSPWSVPPGGARPRPRGPSALDEFLKRARGGGGGPGNGSGGGGRPGSPNAGSLALIGIGLIVLVWVLFTSIHPIGPQQRGVVTYFGRYAGTLDSGIRLTLPAPIASVRKIDVQNINTENFPETGTENLTLTGDQNIIDLAYSVRWNVSNPQDYAFQIKDPVSTVKATAESAMRAVIATTTLDDAIGAGRAKIEGQVQMLMQQILDSYNTGVRIQGVAIKNASAPQSLVDDFNAVTAAQQEAVANLNQARSYAQQVTAKAQGEAASFDKYYAQYKLAPEVTRKRMYYETMESVLAKTDKTIVETPGVVPYLPLPGSARRLPDAAPAAPAAPAQGGGQ